MLRRKWRSLIMGRWPRHPIGIIRVVPTIGSSNGTFNWYMYLMQCRCWGRVIRVWWVLRLWWYHWIMHLWFVIVIIIRSTCRWWAIIHTCCCLWHWSVLLLHWWWDISSLVSLLLTLYSSASGHSFILAHANCWVWLRRVFQWFAKWW